MVPYKQPNMHDHTGQSLDSYEGGRWAAETLFWHLRPSRLSQHRCPQVNPSPCSWQASWVMRRLAFQMLRSLARPISEYSDSVYCTKMTMAAIWQ